MKKQTFVLEIIGDQNQDWQGSLEWIQGKQRQSFRSVMELLALLESAMPETEADPGNSVELWKN